MPGIAEASTIRSNPLATQGKVGRQRVSSNYMTLMLGLGFWLKKQKTNKQTNKQKTFTFSSGFHVVAFILLLSISGSRSVVSNSLRPYGL